MTFTLPRICHEAKCPCRDNNPIYPSILDSLVRPVFVLLHQTILSLGEGAKMSEDRKLQLS